jgi:hypothetical protein
MADPIAASQTRFVLPPLILHPFTDAAGSLKVLESAKAAAQMLLDSREETQAEQLRRQLLEGRYAEFRMLFFVGKDVFRWLAQCVDYAARSGELSARGLLEQSFAEFLITKTPPDVEAKLRRWGVGDYARIFARAIGIHVQFQEPPTRDLLARDYLRSYYRFADYAYACWKDSVSSPVLAAEEFQFTLYASGEYSKILEEEWNGQP